MNRIVLTCAFACLFLPLDARALTAEKDCFDKAITQADLNDCAGKQFTEADAELNRVYKAVLEKHREDALFVEKLRVAQRAWLAYRDAEIEAKYPHSKEAGTYYGSSFSMCDWLHKTQLTQERIKKLREWLDDSEGDVCAG